MSWSCGRGYELVLQAYTYMNGSEEQDMNWSCGETPSGPVTGRKLIAAAQRMMNWSWRAGGT
jgi:hypothetical protein